MTIGWHFDNTYSKLPKSFLENIKPVPVKDPKLIILNKNLAKQLNLDFSKFSDTDLAKMFSGNSLPEGSETIAQAYAGHQFGHFTMLGDGRAVMLGEHLDKENKRFDIQFKGSGRTSFSRSGDGRAVLGPMLREYIISEAMHALNIPTTRSLAVVSTGEEVIREQMLPGAILTRVASSHIRVGTFQYIAATQNADDLKTLFNYTIDRHYPEIKDSKTKALDLLNLLMQKQCELVINWMRVGFIHGVMNTDNMTVSGETIDYGPCAFMDHYHPQTVFSSIDQNGRYSYNNQPRITKWNLARFAECIIPLIDQDEQKAVSIATETINNFEKMYEEKWLNMMRDKLGLFGEDGGDKHLIFELFTWMENNKADFTNTFCNLMDIQSIKDPIYQNQEYLNWTAKWKKRLEKNNTGKEKYLELMRSVNPIFIPRNHKVEEALKDASENKLETLNQLLEVIKYPYKDNGMLKDYQQPMSNENGDYKTFCGT
ncbi:YdiU family protein [Candidatus Pelagibacter bacterium]|nr:YdiU family protein [Candidatus Pelagibacter bacterium]